MIVSLWGMAGSGKTTLGRQTANELGMTFINLDTYIETSLCKSIPVIFAESGEEYFRIAEKKALMAILEEYRDRDAILATGGGTPCYFNNAEVLIDQTLALYISVPLNILAKRIISDIPVRPLVDGLKTTGEVEKKLKKLFVERRKYYEMCPFTIDGGNRSTASIREEIISRTRAYGKEDFL